MTKPRAKGTEGGYSTPRCKARSIDSTEVLLESGWAVRVTQTCSTSVEVLGSGWEVWGSACRPRD